jgi:hypothetical protein
VWLGLREGLWLGLRVGLGRVLLGPREWLGLGVGACVELGQARAKSTNSYCVNLSLCPDTSLDATFPSECRCEEWLPPVGTGVEAMVLCKHQSHCGLRTAWRLYYVTKRWYGSYGVIQTPELRTGGCIM